MMVPDRSSVILTENRKQEEYMTRFRLIRTVDIFQEAEIYSVFLTTEGESTRAEDFVYDVARDFLEAKRFFERLCDVGACAWNLREYADDLLAALAV